MKVKEGDTVKLMNGKVAKVYSIGCALALDFVINLDDGTFCFEDDIVEVIKDEENRG